MARAVELVAEGVAGSRRRRAKRGWRPAPPGQAASLFLVGLDQKPVRIARAYITAEAPQIARLHRIAERAGNDLPIRIARDRGDVRLEAHGDDRDRMLDRGFGDNCLLDGD